MNLFLLLLVVSGCFGIGARGGSRDGGLGVRVEVSKYPKVGEGAVLACKYDLGTDSLYTLKWYKGNGEFYRFTPKEIPATKIFKFPGLEVNERYSNATHLFLHRVDLSMSGKYSCEVTTDAPDFTTDIKTEYLTVVAIPVNKPYLTSPKPRYAVGDFLNITCSSFRSRPAANLTWYINNRPANLEVPLRQERWREDDLLESSSLNLGISIKATHFIQGRLSLRCTAAIYDRYKEAQETSVLEEIRPKISSVLDSTSTQSHPHQPRSQGHMSQGLKFDTLLLTLIGIYTVLISST